MDACAYIRTCVSVCVCGYMWGCTCCVSVGMRGESMLVHVNVCECVVSGFRAAGIHCELLLALASLITSKNDKYTLIHCTS